MNNTNKTTQPDLAATFANLNIEKDQQQQQQQQPRFIRKKPQVIQSIEQFSQEIMMNQVVNTSPEVAKEERRQTQGQDPIQVMMEQLKKQKIEEIMQRTTINPPFPEEEIKLTGSRVQSPSKTKEIDITIRSEGAKIMQPQMSMSPEQRNLSKGRQEQQRHGSAQTLDELKQRKLEELTQMVIQEQRLSRQSYHAFMSQPYATAVSHPQIVEEEDCRSESTVQYHLDESAAKSSIKKRQSPQKRAPSPQNNSQPTLKQPQKEILRPKSAMVIEKPISKVVQSKVTAIKEQVQQTKSKLTKVNESRNKAQPLASIEKKQFATQTPLQPIHNTKVSRNQQTTAASVQTKDYLKTTTSSFINQVSSDHSVISIPTNTTNILQHEQQLTQNLTPPLHQLEFYNDSQRTQQPSLQQQTGGRPIKQQPNQSIQLSEKTLQIVFKKLQKDCENAIRQADREEKGSLTMEQLKKCFFLLDYLPCMQLEEQESLNQQQIQAFLGYRQHVSTKKSLVMQEKEFVYNFWSILNPMNNPEISNALAYDMLLLLIYNVQQSLQTSTEYLNEYLENFYRETNIDIDRFANYHSGNSGSHDYSPLKKDDFSNLNKYLSQCNLWSVERLAFEFRQIHANRLSHLFSSSQQTKKDNHSGERNSLSPMAFKSPHVPNIVVNPADGRKYKKAVVEEHLSNMTFSPKINSKTNQLDQKLTHRLMQRDNSNNREQNSQQNVHRDASVDALLSQANRSGVHNSQFMLNLEPVDGNGIFTGACPSFKRYDLLLYRQQMTHDKIERAQEGKLMKQMQECTFKPNLRPNSPSFHPTLANAKSYQNLKSQTEKVFRDITQRVKDQRSRLLDPIQAKTQNAGCGTAAMTREEKELENCTFHPKINTTPMRRQENESMAANAPSAHPKGYFEMINRMRKVNEEKRDIEEKMQKKAIGENYDRVKLMNIKPPSFVAGERIKKKLIMYIDVNITPTRTGRIGIYEGDDVRELAKNFKKTFQLNTTMQTLLTQQLEHHLHLYKEKTGLTDVQGSVFPPDSHNNDESPDTERHQLDPYMMNSRGAMGSRNQMMQSNSSSQTLDGLNLGRPTRSAYLLDNIDEEESKSQKEPHQNGLNKRSLEIPDTRQYMPMTLTNESRLGGGGGLTFGQIFSNAHKSYQQQSSSSGGNLEQNDAHFYENEDESSQQQQKQLDLNLEYQRLTAGAPGGGSTSHRRRGGDHQLDCLVASESEKQRPQLPAEVRHGFYGLPINPITDFQQFSLQNKNESFF